MELTFLVLGALILVGLVVVIVQNATMRVRLEGLAKIEAHCMDIEAFLRDLSGDMGFGDVPPGPMFRTMDGKHTANSLDELINKMRRDENASPEDIEEFKNFFERGFDGSGPDSLEDHDEDGPEDSWKKGK